MAEYEAIVFDNDGVLVEPSDRAVIVDAVVDTFRAFGVEVERSVEERTVEEGVDLTAFAREHGLNPEALWHHRELTVSLAQQAHTRDGGKQVYDDVAALADIECPLGLVSNNQHATIEFLLAYHALPAFETAQGRTPTLAGAGSRKPNPDYLQQALDELGTSDALYVGDSETDIVAAHRAGVDAAFLRREHVAETALSVDPELEVETLRELVARVA